MNYGLYMSTAGMLTKSATLDALSNNLANVTTTAFKPDRVFLKQREPARVEDGLPYLPSDKLLEQLGGGTLMAPTYPDLTPAALHDTGSPLDLAIQGDGFFQIADGPDSTDVRLTRDGRFMLDENGRLVRADDGRAVLDDSGADIELDPTLEVHIAGDGSIYQAGDVVATLGIVSPAAPNALVKAGGNLFKLRDAGARTNPATGVVRQGMLENSGVDPVSTMTQIIDVARAFERNLKMIQIFDQNLTRAINTLGRVV